jgi:hypothetical protein
LARATWAARSAAHAGSARSEGDEELAMANQSMPLETFARHQFSDLRRQ